VMRAVKDQKMGNRMNIKVLVVAVADHAIIAGTTANDRITREAREERVLVMSLERAVRARVLSVEVTEAAGEAEEEVEAVDEEATEVVAVDAVVVVATMVAMEKTRNQVQEMLSSLRRRRPYQ